MSVMAQKVGGHCHRRARESGRTNPDGCSSPIRTEEDLILDDDSMDVTVSETQSGYP